MNISDNRLWGTMKVVNASSRGWSGRSGELPGGRFTLIELLVVVSIIAVLAAILLPVLGRAKFAAQNVLCMNNLRQQTTGLLMYMDDNGEYPPSTPNTVNLSMGLPHYRFARDLNFLSRYVDNGRTYVGTAMPPVEQLSPVWSCPFFRNSPSNNLSQTFPAPIGTAYRVGYSYTAGLPAVISATPANIIVKPETIPTSRSTSRLVLLADTVSQDTLTTTPTVSWGYFHLPSSGKNFTPGLFPGMNRGYTDGSVVWTNGPNSSLDLSYANRNTAANFRFGTSYYYYW